jgi:hypothetical protein
MMTFLMKLLATQQIISLKAACGGYLDHPFLKHDKSLENNQAR